MGALQGIRVLDLTRYFSGPTGSLFLAELGAEIIKVEAVNGGDAGRYLFPTTKAGDSYQGIILNRGKKSITLNLKSEKGIEIALKLIKNVDVLLENFAPGVMGRLGLSYHDVVRVNPSIIYASISGFGQEGPDAYRMGYDIVAEARGGVMSVTGFADGPPTKAGPAIGDYLGGAHAVIAILAALRHKDKTGEGQYIDISLLDGVWLLTSIEHLGYYFLTGKNPERLGNEHLPNSPSGSFKTKDGWIVVNLPSDLEWQRLVKLIGREELATDPKFASNAERVKRRPEVNAIFTAWTQERTMGEAVNELSKARVACSEVYTFDQVPRDPQLLGRNMIVDIDQPNSGRLKMPGSVFKLSKTPGRATEPAPALGEHNYDVYSNLLGFTPEEINELSDKGVI